ncbi:tetratricopeptide repeat protein [Brevundimonas sp.]|uniref:tetratricopeptide repeat protein n=1 Tax=Brevundimonas sp. TaxID=1871086 RepID=UPI002FDA189B
MVDVFEQVEEDLRSDRYSRMARRWLPVVGGVLAVALAVALAWWGWDTWQTSQANKASVAYDRGMEALQANNLTGADTAFAEAVKAGNGAYKALALSQQAGLALQRNNKDEAVRLLDQAAKASRDPLLSDQAALKAVFLLMEGRIDAAKFADIQKRVEPLTKEGRPLRAFAQEALALAQLQMGQIQPARAAFVQLQLGQDVPDQVRQRAQAAIDTIDTGIAPALPQIVTAMDAIPPTSSLTPEQRGQAAPAAAPAPAQ